MNNDEPIRKAVDQRHPKRPLQRVWELRERLVALGVDLGKKDLLPRTSEHEVANVRIRSLNAGGLILFKTDALRPKDQLDVKP